MILKALQPHASPAKKLERMRKIARSRLQSDCFENLMASEQDSIMLSDIGNMEGLNASQIGMFKGRSQML